MSKKQSAGILLYRFTPALEVLLVHPGGPFWVNKDIGAWSIPKGQFDDGADVRAAARKEFGEETGMAVPEGEWLPLSPCIQSSGKVVHAWAVKGDLDASRVHSNTFQLEWPPKSGLHREFPEVDRAQWFDVPMARMKIHREQKAFIDELAARLGRE